VGGGLNENQARIRDAGSGKAMDLRSSPGRKKLSECIIFPPFSRLESDVSFLEGT